MCGIAGVVSIGGYMLPALDNRLRVMSDLIAHRGPDGHGEWTSSDSIVGLVHRRLAIIDLSESAAQPMHSGNGLSLTHNGEIYNYKELRQAGERDGYQYTSNSDTETILSTYVKYGVGTPSHLRGMFSFGLWDEPRKRFMLARDRLGIKPLLYAIVDGVLYFASEAKALVPFLPSVEIDQTALAEYLTFQYTLGDQTLFAGIRQLMPGHILIVQSGVVSIEKYWDVQYEINYGQNPEYFAAQLRELLHDSINVHLRSDVEVGSYISGGIDSTLIAVLAGNSESFGRKGFHGRFLEYPGYDESNYAQVASHAIGGELFIKDITSNDFQENIRRVLYHLDFPVAGPGSFPQFMVSELASQHLKVVLGTSEGGNVVNLAKARGR